MKSKIIKIFIILALIWGIYQMASYAAVTAGSKTVNSGENVSISLTSNVPLTSYRVDLTSEGGLTFQSSSGGTGAGTKAITGSGTPEAPITSLATYTFKTPSVTEDTTYTVTFSTSIMEDANFAPVSGGTVTAKVTVKAPQAPQTPTVDNSGSNTGSSTQNPSSSNSSGDTSSTTKSNNANLSALSVSPGELSPAFSSSRKTYTVYVESDVEELKISPTLANSKAKYSVSGHRQLEEGENPAKIVVTAEDGTTNTYTINIIKAKSLNLKLSDLIIEGFTLTPEFDAEIYEYTITPEEYIESLSITANPQEEFTPVEITGNENLIEGENVITITLKSPDGTVTQEYKIKVINPVKIEQDVLGVAEENSEETGITQEDINYMKRQIIVRLILIVVLSLIIALLTYYLVQLYVKQQEEYDDEYDEYDDYREDENVNKKQDAEQEKDSAENIENIEDTESQQEQQSKYDIVDRRKYKRDSGRGKHF